MIEESTNGEGVANEPIPSSSRNVVRKKEVLPTTVNQDGAEPGDISFELFPRASEACKASAER